MAEASSPFVQLKDGRYEMASAVRKVTNEQRSEIRIGDSGTSPAAQTKVVSEPWLLDPSNTERIVFGFVGGSFTSQGLTAVVVKELVAQEGVLSSVRYNVYADAEATESLDEEGFTDTLDTIMMEYMEMWRRTLQWWKR